MRIRDVGTNDTMAQAVTVWEWWKKQQRPTTDAIAARFGVSRSTAYRWKKTLSEAAEKHRGVA